MNSIYFVTHVKLGCTTFLIKYAASVVSLSISAKNFNLKRKGVFSNKFDWIC